MRQWSAVLAGIAGGRLTVGSRTPVDGLPAWVTPEVVRGGFATGTPAASGPLTDHEEEAARRAGIPATRAGLFAHALTEEGLAGLWDLLDSGRYEVTLPEETALLTVAWLVRAGDIDAAAALVTELHPFADRLRFLPRPADRPAADAGDVHRRTVGEVSAQLARRQPNTAVEAQREALTVWRPFEDELLTFWLRHGSDVADSPARPASAPGASRATLDAWGTLDAWARQDTRVTQATRATRAEHDSRDVRAERSRSAGTPLPADAPHDTPHRTPPRDAAAWRAEAVALLERYQALAAAHPLCGKHRDPKSNAGILRRALEETAAGRQVPPRLAGLLRHAVTSMVAKRGLPGSPEHTRLREGQARQAALPSHHRVAALVVRRLAALDQRAGTSDVDAPVIPVTSDEAVATGLPAGTAVPPRLRAVVRSALSAPLETLVERGVVPSAEALAALVPQLVAAATAERHPDPALRTLAAATYRAFRNRRSLLLLNLQHQVRVEELPWVRAVAGHGTDAGTDERARAAAASALRRLGSLAVGSFPGTLLPNPLVRELSQLARQAELSAPFVEELAADIFMGTFTPKFLTAARIAADLLEGSLYARYYGIDCAAVRSMAVLQAAESLARKEQAQAQGQGARTTGQPATAAAFAELCAERAAAARAASGGSGPGASPRSWSPAVNGTVIEQAQILTTHNLAVLVRQAGIVPAAGWEELAQASFTTVCRLVARVHGHPRPLGTVKDAAYAWRQMLFHLSLCAPERQAAVVDRLAVEAARQPWHVAARLGPAVAGLRMVAAGGTFGPDGTAQGGLARRFLGWSTGGHWMCRRTPEGSAAV
ncbi:hypothetical protein [Streptomyces antimicrobicus]|uniref:Uncharacterized protein n=2 Tax=Streptomyces antimicrobicus TaxID=2883108 RepID=A0ABS8BAB2_9ACTN|nr:hypothetical protein [Streptomyces antimicrobicus]MCB5181565.1 hypothetical protein [Streptomyces antimicrobicus]